jgi:hypothetical protein
MMGLAGLSSSALDALLSALNSDRERAGDAYEGLRERLLWFFRSHRCARADRLTDDTLDRVARRLAEGERIHNVQAYAARVATFVLAEGRRHALDTPLDAVPPAALPSADPRTQEVDALAELSLAERMERQRRCLQMLRALDFTFIVEYHRGRGRERIERRRRLAAALGIGLNAARIRAHRIRTWLLECAGSLAGGPLGAGR